MLDRYSKSLNSMPLRVKKLIHVVNFFDSDDIMSYSTTILYVENTVKNFFCGIISDEITSTSYDDNNDSFKILFQYYTASGVKNIYHPSIVEEFKSNMYRAYSADKLHWGVYLTSEKR